MSVRRGDALPPVARALVFVGLLSACGPIGRAPLIQRTVGERSRVGIFVSPSSYENFLRAELARETGDLRIAAERYQAARSGPEDDVLIIARLADVYDRLDREQDALALLDEGDALDPNSETLHLARGQIHERRGRPEEAERAYAAASAAAPRSEAGPLALAALMRAQSQPERADAVLERYLSRAGGAGAARARLSLAVEHGDAYAAAEAVRALLEHAPARAGEVREAVTVALDAGRPELALRLLAAMPEIEEDRPLRLRAMLAARRPDEARALLATWMPEGPTELLRVAEGYLATGDAARAHDLAQVALRGDGGASARLVLGRALRALERPDEAASVLATIEPGSQAWPAAPLELAQALRDAGQPGLAAEALSQARARRDDLRLALALASAREAAGNRDGAIAAVEGDDPRLVAARAGLLERGGDEAANALYAGLDPDAPSLSARDRARVMAERAAASGDGARATERLRAWTERAPGDLAGRVRLVELLEAAGEDTGEAREALRPLLVEPGLIARLE